MPSLTKPEIARILDVASASGVSLIESPDWFWDNWQTIVAADTLAEALALVPPRTADLAMLVDSALFAPTSTSLRS